MTLIIPSRPTIATLPLRRKKGRGLPDYPEPLRDLASVMINEAHCRKWRGGVCQGPTKDQRGTEQSGYGQCWDAGRKRTNVVHRLGYEQCCGRIPPGWVVDHLCICKLCIEIMHLEAVPGALNQARARLVAGGLTLPEARAALPAPPLPPGFERSNPLPEPGSRSGQSWRPAS